MFFHNLLGSLVHQVVTYVLVLAMVTTSSVPLVRQSPRAAPANRETIRQAALPDSSFVPASVPVAAPRVESTQPSLGASDRSAVSLLNAGALNEASFEPPALASPLSVSRAQSAYTAAGAMSNTLIITFTVTNNRVPAHAPGLPVSATVTETIQALSAVDLSDDPNVIHNVLVADGLLPANASFVSADPMPDRDGDSLAWNLGDIPPLGSITASLRVQIPGSFPDFTDLDTGAAAWGALQGRSVSAYAAPARLAPDGFGDWLTWTVDADYYDQYVMRKAAELGSDWQEIFAYVRSLGYESYKGSLRGARGTLWSEAGNSLDQASLLIAMLRGSGIPARYRHGTLSAARAQELILSMFPEPTSIIGHIPPGTELADPANDPELLSETMDHWWVEAYLPGLGWTDLDPCFADAAPGQTFYVDLATDGTDQIAEVPDSLRHKVTIGNLATS